MNGITSFEPSDAASLPTGGDPATADLGLAPKNATLTPDQLAAFGLDTATPGSKYTINVTVGDVSDAGTSVTVDDSAAADDGLGIEGETPMTDPIAPPPTPDPPLAASKPKPSVVGPERLKRKL